MEFNRYSKLYRNGTITKMPPVTINTMATDYHEQYIRGKSRLDNISFNYYGNPDYGWLILLANPNVGGLEFNIPDGTMLRIPFPLELALEDYNNKIEIYDSLYGME